MSEYIVCVDDLEESYYKYTDIKPETVFGHRLREEIVRCRDCAWLAKDDSVWKCRKMGFAIDYVTGDEAPNGFCAWGERREP